MKLSKLIKDLAEQMERHGDMEAAVGFRCNGRDCACPITLAVPTGKATHISPNVIIVSGITLEELGLP